MLKPSFRSKKSLVARKTVLSAAVTPLLEMLETRSLFSTAPVAHISPITNINEGQSVLVSGQTSTDSDGTVVNYQWDTNYNAAKGFKNRVQGSTFTFHADNSGAQQIALRVVDNSGDVSAVSTASISIADVAPTITLTAPNSANEAAPVNIAWSYTDPGVSDTVSNWSVDWGDGSTGSFAGSATGGTHTYDEDGSYTITLTASQTDATTSVTHALTVNNVTPIVSASTTTPTVDEGQIVQMDFTSPNRETSLDGWSIDWGDGSIDQYSNQRSHATHTYADNGLYTATVAAQEPDGGQGTSTVQYTVNNVAPDVAIIGAPATGLEGTAISAGSTVSDPGVLDTETYGWSVYRDGQHFILPGGTTLSGQSFTFTPTDNGSYVIRLTVVDKDGGSTTVNSSPIVVANVAPTASIIGTPGSAVNEGTAVSLTATASDVGSEDVASLSYAWTVAKDGAAYTLPINIVANTAGFTFTPRDNGSYVATVVVTDQDSGAVSVSTSAISVNNVAPIASVTAPTTANEGDTISATSAVVDPGADDTQSYAWTVEKQTSSGNGIYTATGTGRGETDSGNQYNFNPGASFTVTARMTVAAGGGTIMQSFYSNYLRLQAVQSGNNYAIRLVDSNGSIVSTPAVVTGGTFFDLAVAYDGSSGATSIYIDGVSQASGTLLTGSGGSNHYHFADGYTGSFDSFGYYPGALTAQDAADLHNNVGIATAPVDVWNFDEAPGSTVATGINGNTLYDFFNPVFSGTTTWAAYTLPSDANTTANNFSFVPADNGTYSIKLTVTDKDGGVSNMQSSNIVVANVAPTGTITGDATGNEGSALNYSVAVTDPGALDTQSYAWSVTKGGQAFALPQNAVTNASTFSFTPDDNAAYVVSVAITDNDGGTTTETQNVTVANVPPTAAITGAPATSPEGTAITLGSTSSDASAADMTAGFTYAWTVTKDGATYATSTTATNQGFTFTPSDNGSYIVSLAVTDKDNATTSVSTSAINVTNVAPTGTISGEPQSAINEGDTVALTAAGADVGSNDVASLTYAWTIKKSGVAWTPLAGTVLNAATVSFVPTDNGSYVATVTITDKDSGYISVDSAAIVANNVAPVAAIIGAPASGTEGTAISLASTVTDAGAADTQSYAWSVTKGGVAVALTGLTTTTDSFTFTPADNGAYVVSLAVTDDDGATTTTSAAITINNAAPVPVITSDNAVNEGHPISLTVAANDPGVNDTETYLWSVSKGGQAYTTGLGATSASTFSFTPNLYGTYIVSAQVTDNDGGTATVSKTITVNNVAPVASITSGLPSGPIGEGTSITLTGAATDAPGETGLTYAWAVTRRNGQAFTLPQGTILNASTFTFTPTDNANYRVTLAVTDSGGLTGSVTTSNIVVTNALPAATMSGMPSGTTPEGTPVTLTVAAADPGAEDTLSYLWSVTKNGNAYALPNSVVKTGTSFTFTPVDQGTWVATCVVTDNDGGPTTVTSGAITVTNVPPNVSISGVPSAPNEGSAITLTGVATDPGINDALSYSWSVTKNGQPYVAATTPSYFGQAFSFTPSDNGTYVATLSVNDLTDTTTVSTAAITVNNVAPAGTIAGPTTSNEGAQIAMTAAATDAGSLDTLTYAWSVTRDGNAVTLPVGATTHAPVFDYTPPDQGAYVFSCVVTDNDGGTSTLTHALNVNNVAPALSGGISAFPGYEGSPTTGTVTASDVDADTISYAWSVTKDGNAVVLPNGTPTTGSSFTFTPTDNGSYVLSVTVSDEDGGSTTATRNVVVANVAPVSTVTGDTTGFEGAAVSESASTTDIGTEDIAAGFTYAWSVTKNGVAYTLPVNTVANAANFVFTPTNEGSYVASVITTDKDGGHSMATKMVAVANVAPTAVINGAPSTAVDEGTLVSLSAAATDPGASDVLTYQWSVTKDGHFKAGTGASTFGTHFGFTATDNGSYVISLTVSDGTDSTTTTSSFTANNVAPSATIAGPTTSNEGSPVTMTATGTDAGIDDLNTLTYAWSVTKDGIAVDLTSLTTSAAAFTYTPADQGAYVFSVLVTDKDGGHSTLTQNLGVANVAPAVAITGAPTTGAEGTAITVGSTVSDPGVNDVLSRGWTVYKNGQPYVLPQGTPNSGAGFTFTPTDNGSYLIRLTAADQDGGSTTLNSAPILVANVAPTAAITGNTTGTEGQLVSLGSTASDVSSADLAAGFTYAWTAKRGNTTVATGNAASFSFTPAVHGTYNVTLAVTDKDGSTTTIGSSIVVANLPPSGVAFTGQFLNKTEGDAVALTAYDVDAPGDTATYSWQVLRGQNVFAQGTGTAINYTAARGTYTISVTATDSAGASITSSTDPFTVANAAPTAVITAPTTTTLLTSGVTFGLNFGDVPANQALNVAWDFGDGSTSSLAYTGDQSITRKHVYAARGTYNVTATVSDGVDQTVVGTIVTVSEAAVLADPIDPTKTALFVTGSDGNDTINVAQQSSGKYGVVFNGTTLGTNYAPTGRVYVYGNGGSNNITVSGAANAYVFAGVKASTVTTGGGNDIIVGSPESDRLTGGAGRDIIIGAAGSDTLFGGDGDDLLVAGGTPKMNDIPTMGNAMATWANLNQTLASRRAALTSLFGSKVITAENGGNQLYGEAGNDWFLANTAIDRIKDLQGTDLVN